VLSSDDEVERTAHHILWECCLWHDERKLMLDSVMATSGAVYYSDLVATRANYHAFRRFCNTYHWTRTQKQLTHYVPLTIGVHKSVVLGSQASLDYLSL
jgi:hypothetical protein